MTALPPSALLAGLLTLAGAGSPAPQDEDAPAPRPNFLILLVDDQAWNGTSLEMVPGSSASKSDYYRTPHLERLGAEGMRFSRSYSSGPNCSPSRAALLTGSTPARLGLTHVVTNGPQPPIPGTRLDTPESAPSLPSEAITLAELLGEAGYHTGYLGKWHLGPGRPEDHGFDHSFIQTIRKDVVERTVKPDPKGVFALASEARDFLEQARDSDRPFFLQVGFNAIHRPLQAREETLEEVRGHPRGARHDRPLYAALTRDLDEAVGVILGALDEFELSSTTYVVYTSDNGAPDTVTTNQPLRSGKGTLFEGGLRIPLVVRGPSVPAGSVCASPVVSHDLFPTLAGWAGVGDPGPDVDGIDLRTAVESGGTAEVERPGGIVFHFPHYLERSGALLRPCSALVEGDRKLIRYEGPREVLLYDLGVAAPERENLAELLPDEVAAMERRLDARLDALGALRARENAIEPESPDVSPGDPTEEESR